MRPNVSRRMFLAGVGAVGVGGIGAASLLRAEDGDYNPGTILVENQTKEQHQVSVEASKITGSSQSSTVFQETATLDMGSSRSYADSYEEAGKYDILAKTDGGHNDRYSSIYLWEGDDGDITGFSTRVRVIEDGSLNIVGTIGSGVKIPDRLQNDL